MQTLLKNTTYYHGGLFSGYLFQFVPKRKEKIIDDIDQCLLEFSCVTIVGRH
jgi:hypothetical protein